MIDFILKLIWMILENNIGVDFWFLYVNLNVCIFTNIR